MSGTNTGRATSGGVETAKEWTALVNSLRAENEQQRAEIARLTAQVREARPIMRGLLMAYEAATQWMAGEGAAAQYARKWLAATEGEVKP